MNNTNILSRQYADIEKGFTAFSLKVKSLINEIENGLPTVIPMQPNQLPSPNIAGPYIVNIESLATGTEYDIVHDYAKDLLKKLSKDDNRIIGQKRFWLANFGKNMSSEAVIEYAIKNGFKSLNMLYVNDFAEANPDLQRSLYIVALGEPNKSVVDADGNRGVLVLGSGGGRRRLDSGSWGGDWDGDGWFLFSE